MHALYIVKKPLVTEKITYGMNEHNQYAFEVDPRASKTEIKKAVEELYNVKVVGVNTQLRKGKHRRLKYGVVTEPLQKRAIVRLAEGSTIELF
ncbi:MAG: 50S ribosomal protein L23 [Phycisphaerales bacterium]|nr:50S ribosomal protein L23 [Phycisphaerales bacterium]